MQQRRAWQLQPPFGHLLERVPQDWLPHLFEARRRLMQMDWDQLVSWDHRLMRKDHQAVMERRERECHQGPLDHRVVHQEALHRVHSQVGVASLLVHLKGSQVQSHDAVSP